MQLSRLAGKDGTCFSGSLITNGNDQIEGVCGHFIRGFAARLSEIDPMPFQCRDGTGMHVTGWMTSRTPGPVSSLSQVVDERFGHDGTARITRAEDQDFLGLSGH